MSDRERFVPHRVGPLIDALCRLPWSGSGDEQRFRALTRLVSALYHYEFHQREQDLLDGWELLDAGDVTTDAVTGELTGLLDAANYTPVTMAELDDAFTRESLIPLRLDVDLDDYEEMLIYRRGSHVDTVEVPKWRGLRTEERTITVDERVIVHARIKPQAWFDERQIDPADRNLVPGHVSLKMFQNVPRADIEMLLPSAQVRFRPIDTLLVGVPAVISGVLVLATKLAPTLGLIFLLIAAWLGLREEAPTLDQTSLVLLFGGAVTLGGFLFRQWSKLKNRRVEYLKTLSENLYFRTVGDGPGVIHILLSSAEEQEILEVVLGYRFLLAAPDGLSAAALDTAIEDWLRTSHRVDVDFEVDDAVAKLRRLAVIDGEKTLRASPLPSALVGLDRRWDDLFQFPDPEAIEESADPGHEDPRGGTHENRTSAGTSLIRLRRVVDRFSGRLGDRLLRREASDDVGDLDPADGGHAPAPTSLPSAEPPRPGTETS